MEAGRTRWTDGRIDDLALGVRDEVRELRAEMREFRTEMRELRSETQSGFVMLRGEIQAEFRAVRGEIAEVRVEAGLNRRLLMSMWLTILLGFAGLIVETGLR